MKPDKLKYVKPNNYNSHSPKKPPAYSKAWNENLGQLHKLPKKNAMMVLYLSIFSSVDGTKHVRSFLPHSLLNRR
jgi:hypothetical protein